MSQGRAPEPGSAQHGVGDQLQNGSAQAAYRRQARRHRAVHANWNENRGARQPRYEVLRQPGSLVDPARGENRDPATNSAPLLDPHEETGAVLFQHAGLSTKLSVPGGKLRIRIH